ncbi:MAG: DUF4421 family protein [Bacteroidota bacterium]
MTPKTCHAVLLTLCLVFSLNSSYARKGHAGGDPHVAAFDSLYIKDYTGLLTTRLFLLFQNASLLINPESDKITKIVYRPNANLRVGVAGFWKWFGLGLSIDNPVYKTDQVAYGKTSTLDLRVNAFGRVVAGEFFLQRYRGFYISSPEAQDGSHYLVPDMRTFSVGLSAFWIFNARRFSIRAAFIQNEGQKKSAGSFILRPSLLYYRITADHGIIPAAISDSVGLPPESMVTAGRFFTAGISPGYTYTLVFMKHGYATAAVFPGIAAQFSTFRNDLKVSSDFAFVFQLSGRFAIGYNTEKWFLGGSFQSGFNEVPDRLNNALFNYDVAQVRVWGGMRFDIFRRGSRKAK